MKKVILAVLLALAFFGTALGAAVTFSVQPAATQIHVLADVTPNVSGCGGSSSGFCG